MELVDKKINGALEAEIAANEVRKEDDLYYQGAFWIKGESVKEIKRGNFSIIGIKLATNYSGDYISEIESKKALTHKRLWPQFNQGYEGKDYTYLPRGRVAIYNGTAFIHLNSLFNQPDIVDKIVEEYCLSKLEIEVDLNDTYQGSHYGFQLK